MMKTKFKTTAAFLAAALLMSLTAACNNQNGGSSSDVQSSSSQAPQSSSVSEPEAEKTTIRMAALKGPTGIGLVKLMEDDENGSAANDYEFTLVGAPDEITAKLAKNDYEFDIAAVPSNVAATLYNKTEGKIKLLAVNTLGVLSIVTKGEDIQSIEDLKGKTIYTSGQGTTTEYVLNYILRQNGLDPEKDVSIVYLSEHAEVGTMLASGEATVAMLPQPFVTSVTQKDPEIKIALDITEEWEKVTEGTGGQLAMGCIVARAEFVEENKEAVDAFLKEYKASTEYVNENVAESAALVEKQDIMAANIAEIAIPKCNIVYIDGTECKDVMEQYLNILFEADAKSVGGALPGEDFYYLP